MHDGVGQCFACVGLLLEFYLAAFLQDLQPQAGEVSNHSRVSVGVGRAVVGRPAQCRTHAGAGQHDVTGTTGPSAVGGEESFAAEATGVAFPQVGQEQAQVLPGHRLPRPQRRHRAQPFHRPVIQPGGTIGRGDFVGHPLGRPPLLLQGVGDQRAQFFERLFFERRGHRPAD